MSHRTTPSFSRSRRSFLKQSAGCAAALVATGLLPGLAVKTAAGAEPAANIATILKSRFGTRPITMKHVSLKVPIIAENGAVVPVRIVTDLPMTAKRYVKKIYLFVDENTNPFIASASLTPANGKAGLQLKIKMRKTSKVRAVAAMNDGSLYGDIKSVKVTMGGCGG